jgi:hypothetical protein
MKTYGKLDIEIYSFFTSELVAGEWTASCPGRFTLGERAPDTRSIGGWLGPSTSMDDTERRYSCPFWDWNSDSSTVQPAASRYTDWVIPAMYFWKRAS